VANPIIPPRRTDPPASAVEPSLSDALVRQELDRVLTSHEFQSSRLCQSFLRYVVENTLDGHKDALKERTIGIEVFGKPVSYDPSEDAGVRVKAGEVRKRLRSYYLSRPDRVQVLIDLPSGAYVPEFRYNTGETFPALPNTRTPKWLWIIGTATVVLVLLFTFFFLLRPRTVSTSFDQFWAPVFRSKDPIFLCTAPVPVYSQLRNSGTNQPGDFVLVPNQFLAVSDVKAALEISEMLTRMKHPYRLLIGSDVNFRDLRRAPAILVGFSYTRWHEIGEHFRYSIDLSRRPFGVSQDGALTSWTIGTHPDDPDLSEDYAIVSRVFYPGTNNIIVEITGISHYGTEAAADLVSNPALLQAALDKLPEGWRQKNVQIVLHVEVVSGSPSVPTVVGAYTW